MSSPSQFYSLVTLSDRVVPGFAGIMRASMMAGESLSSREIKVVIGSPSHVSEGKAISFANLTRAFSANALYQVPWRNALAGC
jgi:hypothetical protein